MKNQNIYKNARKIMEINEVLRQRINKLITEEFGINNEFDEKAKSVTKSIINNLKGSKFIQRNDGVLVKNHKETVILNDKKVSIYISNYYFENTDEMNSFFMTHITPQGYSPITKSISIPLFTIGNETDYAEFYDTVYHELDHFFKDTFLSSPKEPSEKYFHAISNIYSEDKVLKTISEIYYCADRNEQDAMINGLYGKLSNVNYNENWFEALKDSEAAIWIKKLYNDYLFLKNTDINEKYFNGKTKQSFLSFTLKVIKSFERKLARVVFKLKKDKLINEGIRPHISTKLNINNKQGQLFWI